ncbi:CHC2 zinc finger domain-containing protein [Inquilinus limosus]|uniref:Zinc finger CHC2-type domain-containing protein n=1 Tax=Inquilinus limosus TaxID=171674 RepID=A0A211ZQG0_9PROT|nr:hypothetical protein BWR60_09465 [Inquilinus limosus]
MTENVIPLPPTGRLSDLIGRDVDLKPSRFGRGHEFIGLCPFHDEKTPSFTVNDRKGTYQCLSCGAHGDAQHYAEVRPWLLKRGADGKPQACLTGYGDQTPGSVGDQTGAPTSGAITNFRFGEMVGAIANALSAFTEEERLALLERWPEAGRQMPVAFEIVAQVRAGIASAAPRPSA